MPFHMPVYLDDIGHCKPILCQTERDNLGSHAAQLVGCWTHNPRDVGSIPGDADCFMWDNILGQDDNLDCASLHQGVLSTWLLVSS